MNVLWLQWVSLRTTGQLLNLRPWYYWHIVMNCSWFLEHIRRWFILMLVSAGWPQSSLSPQQTHATYCCPSAQRIHQIHKTWEVIRFNLFKSAKLLQCVTWKIWDCVFKHVWYVCLTLRAPAGFHFIKCQRSYSLYHDSVNHIMKIIRPNHINQQ